MKLRLFSTPGLLALLSATPAMAVTDTWDGGGADNNITTGANWLDNTAPASDLVNTDLIFGGAVRLAPNLSASFSTDSLTFNNTASGFTFTGGTLTVGAGGIVNNDADLQVFTNPVIIGTASSTLNAASGALQFQGALALGANALSVPGNSNTTLFTLSGSGAITKSGTGTLLLNQTGTHGFDLTLGGGTFTTGNAGATVFSSASVLQVNSGTFQCGQNLTLDGAQMSVGATGTLAASGFSTIVQNSGLLSYTNSQTINGTTTLLAASGGQITCGGFMDFASVAAASVTCQLSGTSLLQASGLTDWGRSGGTANVTISTNSSGSFATGLRIADSGASGGATVSLQSGGQITAATLQIGANATGSVSTTTIDGAGTKATVSGTGTFILGSAGAGTHTMTIQNGGVFDSGTGAITIGANGTLNMNGNFLADGSMTVNGTINRSSVGFLLLAAGKNLTVQNGGDLNFGGADLVANAGSTITLTGAGTTYNGSFITTLAPNSALNVTAGATASISGNGGLQANSGTVIVDGVGSSLSSVGSANAYVGTFADTASVTYRNNAGGTYNGTLSIPQTGQSNTTGNFTVESGADVTASSVFLAGNGNNPAGTLTVDGAGSTFSQSGIANLIIGQASGGTGVLNVTGGAGYTTGSANNTLLNFVNATGSINLTGAGSSFTVNAPMSVTGQVTTGAGTVLNLQRSVSVSGGGDVTMSAQPVIGASGSVFVSGTGSTFTTASGSGAAISLYGPLLQVSGGGLVQSAADINLGFAANIQVTVDGVGSALRGSSSYQHLWGLNGFTSTLTFSNGSAGEFGLVKLAELDAGTSVTLNVQSGSDLTLVGLGLAGSTDATTGIVNVTGTGSTLTVQTNDLSLGASAGSAATLNITDNGTVTLNSASGNDNLILNPTGTVNLDGGSLILGDPILRAGGTFNFLSGSLSLDEALTIGSSGLLGADVTLAANRTVVLPATALTQINPFNTLTLDGGRLSTGNFANQGALDFRRGTLEVTGSGGLNLFDGSNNGSRLTLGPDAHLAVTNSTGVSSGGVLTIAGGTFSSGSLGVSSSFRLESGSASISGTAALNSGAQMFLADTLSTGGTFTNFNGGRLTLQNGTGLLTGAGVLNNNGLISGDGVITKGFTNNSPGEVRAESGKFLAFTGVGPVNNGRLNLLGGILEFAAPLSNGTTGQINGHGELYFPASPVPSSGSPAAGLNTSGQMNLSGGDSLIFGTVAVNGAGKVIASGGASATFFDVFRHSGAEVKASAGSALVFFGQVRGAGPFTGTGTIYMEGGYSPGASPTSVSIAPQMVFTNSNVLTMEIGGLTPGTQHDQLTFTHAATPQVEWGGTLAVEFINGFTPAAGQSFDLFEFDAARDAGTFDAISLPALPGGLQWNTSQLHVTGNISIQPAGITFADWASASGIPGALPGGDHDNDGFDNATEFALGLFPAQPGTVLPGGGFHTYVDGAYLRLLFTRPLDRTGVTLTVEASDDLAAWTPLATSTDSQPFTGSGFVSEDRAHPLSDPGLVEVRDRLPVASNPRRQMRVSVVVTP